VGIPPKSNPGPWKNRENWRECVGQMPKKAEGVKVPQGATTTRLPSGALTRPRQPGGGCVFKQGPIHGAKGPDSDPPKEEEPISEEGPGGREKVANAGGVREWELDKGLWGMSPAVSPGRGDGWEGMTKPRDRGQF